jgi:hypothetical protein
MLLTAPPTNCWPSVPGTVCAVDETRKHARRPICVRRPAARCFAPRIRFAQVNRNGENRKLEKPRPMMAGPLDVAKRRCWIWGWHEARPVICGNSQLVRCSLGIRRLYFFHRRRRRIHSRLFYFPLFTGRKTRRPIELLAFGMGSYQGVGTQLEKVAAIFESEFSNYPFEPF